MSLVFDAISDVEIRLTKMRGPISRLAHGIVVAAIDNVLVPRGDPWVHASVHGIDMLLPISHNLPRYVAQYPYYDTVLPAFTKFLRAGQRLERRLVLVDVGANVGDTARLVGGVVGHDNVEIICIEADEAYLPLLHRNTEGLAVSVHNVIAAASTRQTNASMSRSKAGTSSIAEGGEQRSAVALDDLLANREVDVLKIDTDGYEVEVLRGSLRTLERCSPAVYIEFSPEHLVTYGKTEPAEVLRILRDAGYSHGIVYDHLGYPMTLTELTDSAVRSLINYCRVKPRFYVDILLTKDVAQLERFYEADLPRYQ
jgi:FkbM family methyltransferase